MIGRYVSRHYRIDRGHSKMFPRIRFNEEKPITIFQGLISQEEGRGLS